MPRMFYQDRNDDAIATCDPAAQIAFRRFQYRLSRAGESVLITEGFRGKEKQEQDFKNRTSQVHFPYSAHNQGIAIDLAPVLFGQKWLVYNAASRYERIGAIAKECNIQWGFEIWGFDKPHFQYMQGHPIEYFVQGGKLNVDTAKAEARLCYSNHIHRLEDALARPQSLKREKELLDELAYVNSLLSAIL